MRYDVTRVARWLWIVPCWLAPLPIRAQAQASAQTSAHASAQTPDSTASRNAASAVLPDSLGQTTPYVLPAEAAQRAIVASPREHLVTDPAAYQHYVRPGQCEAAGRRAKTYYWRDKRPDTVFATLGNDSVPRVVQAVVAACLTHFSVQTVAEHQLAPYVLAAAYAGQPDVAKAAAARLIALTAKRPAAERGAALYSIVEAYLRASWLPPETVTPYLTQLRALGAPAAEWIYHAYSYALSRAVTHEDGASAMAMGEIAMTAAAQMPHDDRVDNLFDFDNTYEVWAEGAWLQGGPSAAFAILDRAKQDLSTLREVGSPQYAMIQNSIQNAREPYERIGQPVPPIQASDWFNTGGDTSARPRRGVVTFVHFVNANCGGGCYRDYAILRRLQALYGPRGFEIVLVGGTSGFFHTQMQTSTEEEIENERRYFEEYLHLPGVLAINATRFVRVPDGRRFPEPDENERHYGRWSDVFVGRDGAIRYVTYLQKDSWERLQHVVEQALSDGPSASGVSAPGVSAPHASTSDAPVSVPAPAP